MIWFIGLFLLFSIATSVLVVAASMNSSRISQEDPWSEEPLYEGGSVTEPLSSQTSTARETA
jgi:hypothetical protein